MHFTLIFYTNYLIIEACCRFSRTRIFYKTEWQFPWVSWFVKVSRWRKETAEEREAFLFETFLFHILPFPAAFPWKLISPPFFLSFQLCIVLTGDWLYTSQNFRLAFENLLKEQNPLARIFKDNHWKCMCVFIYCVLFITFYFLLHWNRKELHVYWLLYRFIPLKSSKSYRTYPWKSLLKRNISLLQQLD